MVNAQGIAEDIRNLAILLQTQWGENLENETVLFNLFHSIDNENLNYEINPTNSLIFKNINLGRNHNLSKNSIAVVKLEMMLKCKETKDSYTDSINALGVSISILAQTGEEIQALQTWHLDKASEPSKAGNEEFIHPTYHLNFGGKKMKKEESRFGALLLLSSPRISHPPLDIVLSIDFILRNFYTHDIHRTITENKTYKKIVKNAVNRFWRPFALTYASFWLDDIADIEHISVSPSDLFPSLNC